MARKSWDDMTRRERRLALARDVKAHIQNEKWEARRGFSYLEDNYSCDVFKGRKTGDPITKKDVRELGNRCGMCARGALMLSRIDKFNGVKWGEIAIGYRDFTGFRGVELSVNDDTTSEVLDGSFDDYELDLIERVFECPGMWGIGLRTDPNDVLLMIMQVIIDNKGAEFTESLANKVKEYEVTYE